MRLSAGGISKKLRFCARTGRETSFDELESEGGSSLDIASHHCSGSNASSASDRHLARESRAASDLPRALLVFQPLVALQELVLVATTPRIDLSDEVPLSPRWYGALRSVLAQYL